MTISTSSKRQAATVTILIGAEPALTLPKIHPRNTAVPFKLDAKKSEEADRYLIPIKRRFPEEKKTIQNGIAIWQGPVRITGPFPRQLRKIVPPPFVLPGDLGLWRPQLPPPLVGNLTPTGTMEELVPRAVKIGDLDCGVGRTC